MARNFSGKYTKLRWSYIIGYIDSFDVVHSEIFSLLHDDDFHEIKLHVELFGIKLKNWRWDYDKGLDATIGHGNFDKEDIVFGFELAKAIGSLDIGQTVAVKNKAIVAVEAFEGTDNLIRRSGKLAGKGLTIVKVSKPKQDMRFDIPVIGYNTVKTLVKVHAHCLAIEAEKTLFIDKEKSLQVAERFGISIVAV